MGQGCAQQVLLSTLTLLDLFALLLRVQGSVFVSASAFFSLCVNVPRGRCCDGAWHRWRELVAGRAAAAAAAAATAAATWLICSCVLLLVVRRLHCDFF